MGIISSLLGGGATNIVQGVSDAVDKFVQTPDEKAAQELKLKAMDMQVIAKQLEVNAAEAAHRSVFVAGWRPFIGWVCGVVIAWTFIVLPLVEWGTRIWAPGTPLPPALDLTELWPVIVGMLGLGAARTYEKKQGVSK